MTLLQIICDDTDITVQLLIIYSAFIKYFRRNGNEFSNKSLWFSTMIIMYNIVIGFGIHKQLLKLIKYVYITPIAIYGHANLCLICFILRMVHKMEMFYHHCFSTLLQNMPVGRSKQITSCYNSTVHIRSLFMLMVLIYGVKAQNIHTISFISPL